jgi:AcrR family transcriptional regulator
MTAPSRARLARGSLDAERVLDAAFELAGQVGLGNLSMPLLAAHLDVGVTSIYWHVRNRDDLLRQMAARAVARLDKLLPAPTDRDPAEWQQFLREYFSKQRSAFTGDDLLTDLTAMRNAKYGPETIELGYLSIERILRYLTSAGFTPVDGWNLYCSLSLYTQGFAVVERRSRATGLPRSGASQVEILDEDATPLIAQLLREEAISIDFVGDATFGAGLQWLLDGAAHRASAASCRGEDLSRRP